MSTHVKHHQVEGKAAYGFWGDWIGTLVAMTTLSCHRLIMGKSFKIFLSETSWPTAYCYIIEPWHWITSNMVCATSKASDQPAHMRSLI